MENAQNKNENMPHHTNICLKANAKCEHQDQIALACNLFRANRVCFLSTVQIHVLFRPSDRNLTDFACSQSD